MSLSVKSGVEVESKSPSIVKKALAGAMVLAIMAGGLIVHGNSVQESAAASPIQISQTAHVNTSNVDSAAWDMSSSAMNQKSLGSIFSLNSANYEFVNGASVDVLNLVDVNGSLFAQAKVSVDVNLDALNSKISDISSPSMQNTGFDLMAKLGQASAQSRMSNFDDGLQKITQGYQDSGFSFKVKMNADNTINQDAFETSIQRGVETAMSRTNDVIHYGDSSKVNFTLSGTSLEKSMSFHKDKGDVVASASVQAMDLASLATAHNSVYGQGHTTTLSMNH